MGSICFMAPSVHGIMIQNNRVQICCYFSWAVSSEELVAGGQVDTPWSHHPGRSSVPAATPPSVHLCSKCMWSHGHRTGSQRTCALVPSQQTQPSSLKVRTTDSGLVLTVILTKIRFNWFSQRKMWRFCLMLNNYLGYLVLWINLFRSCR